MEQIDLKNKVALITGSSRGIGRQTAIRMANAGARVAVNYHRSEKEALAVFRQIGNAAMVVRADVSKPDEVEEMTRSVIERWGRIDILVNNAATFDMNPFDGDDYAAWQRGWKRTFE